MNASLPASGTTRTAPARPSNLCSSATSRLIDAKDHASVQINIAQVDASGVITGANTTFVLSGFVRRSCESDDSLNRLATQAGLLKR